MASLELRTFQTPEELKKFLDDEIGRLRTLLGDHLRRLEEARIKAEKLRKAHDALAKFAGSKQIPNFEGREVDMTGLRVMINPTPRQEMDLLEEVVKTLQDKLNTVQRVRKAFDPLAVEEGIVTITVAIADNVPHKLMLYLRA